MSASGTQFYLTQAAEVRERALAEPLQNVRDNLDRCAAAWDALAIRSMQSDKVKAREAARKVQQEVTS